MVSKCDHSKLLIGSGQRQEEPTFPSRFSCTISWSEFPIPMKAHVVESCSVPPSASMASFFRFQPLPKRYIQGGGQKNLLNHKIELNPWSSYFHCYGISVIKCYFFCCYKSDMWWFWCNIILFMLLYNFLKHNVFSWDFWELCV